MEEKIAQLHKDVRRWAENYFRSEKMYLESRENGRHMCQTMFQAMDKLDRLEKENECLKKQNEAL
jgi:hypothetical protein